MKAKVLKPFKDLKEDKERHEGDVFELTKKRFTEIEKAIPGYIKEVKKDDK